MFFAGEPILRVVAPLPEAQLVETRIINLLNFQSMIASKAARCRLAAGERHLADFGLRRAHGAEAGLLAARACYLAGFDATGDGAGGSKLRHPAHRHHGPLVHPGARRRSDRFQGFRAHPPARSHAADRHLRHAARGAHGRGTLSRAAWRSRPCGSTAATSAASPARCARILDAGGCHQVRIIASGNLDEYEIARLVACGAPIDAFGVGTRLDVSVDAPYLECVYKLQEYAGRPRRKRSTGKATWPGRKQVFREYGSDGVILSDAIGLVDETLPGRPMLAPAMRAGHRLGRPTLAEVRDCTRREIATLPAECRRLHDPEPVAAGISDGLRDAAARVDREFP